MRTAKNIKHTWIKKTVNAGILPLLIPTSQGGFFNPIRSGAMVQKDDTLR